MLAGKGFTFVITKLNEAGDMETTGEDDRITTFEEGIVLAAKFNVNPE